MAINIFSLLTNIMLARALFVAAELNIAEHISLRPMYIEELANVTQTDKSCLNRLLYFLELNGVFKRQDEKIYNTEFSETMRFDHPNSIKPFLLHDDETRWNSFGHLGYSIKTGTAAFDMIYGESYFDYLKNHQNLSERFDKAMSVISTNEDEQIAKQIKFNGIVVDIGGGEGQLLNKILYNSLNVNGILFDLPEVINRIKNNDPRIQKISGSFFKPILIDADVFILKRILHDWDDERALQILKNINNTMKEDAKLYIIDAILDHTNNKKFLAAVDLALLSIFKGRERKLDDINKLLIKSGFEIINLIQITDVMCVLECKKVNV